MFLIKNTDGDRSISNRSINSIDQFCLLLWRLGYHRHRKHHHSDYLGCFVLTEGKVQLTVLELFDFDW